MPSESSAVVERGVAEQLLATKLLVPTLGREVLARRRLVERLESASQRRLTVVAAPAGFGKTTAVLTWIAETAPPVAWFGLDAADNSLERFLLHLIGAFQARWPEIGRMAAAGLARQPLRPEQILAELVNDLAGRSAVLTLVLDDFELLTSLETLDACAFLIEHQPPNLHLVICTRAEPRLPLPKWRARGQVAEFGPDDLRFTADEAAGFLNQAMALDLSDQVLSTLHERTEGWIAGLQLAALSLRRTPEREGFVAAFAGDHRYIADYLVDEVLRRQPADVEDFLLKTAILERLTAGLCDAVAGRLDSAALLEQLADQNLFLLRLDERRQAYRYHVLFAELLRHRLVARDAAAPARLHGLAATWFEQNGAAEEAIRHVFAAGDGALAADVLDRHVESLLARGRHRDVVAWIAALAESEIEKRPHLGLAEAFARLGGREVERAANRLDQVERTLSTGDAQPFLLAGLRLSQGGLELFRGDLRLALVFGREAAALYGAERAQMNGALETVLALAHHGLGEFAACREAVEAGLALSLAVDHPRNVFVMFGLAIRLDLQAAQLTQAEATARRGLEIARTRGWWDQSFRSTIELALVEVLYEMNRLDEAEVVLASAAALATRLGPDEFEDLATLWSARLKQARGMWIGTSPPLDRERLARADFHGRIFESAHLELLRFELSRGQAAEVEAELRRRGADENVEILDPVREREDLLFAQALVTRGRGALALPLLERLVLATTAGCRRRAMIEALTLSAVARHLSGATVAARDLLQRAFELADDPGLVRTFLDLGPALRALLEKVEDAGAGNALSARLKAAFGAAPPSGARGAAVLAEPIRERELDVLRAIVAGLSNQEIAAKLYLSPNTVKTHIRNLYAKLGASSRAQAIKRAHELALLTPATRS